MDRLGRELLDEVYERFGERSDDLLDATSQPDRFASSGEPAERWTDLGDWLGLAERLGAEKVLFLRGDPVAVFADSRDAPDETSLGELYRRAWCMSEPRCLFIALPNEVRVYALNLPPKRSMPPSDPWRVLSTAADVLELTREVDRFGPDLQGLMEIGGVAPARADRRLIGDLRIVRSQLEETGLSMAEAHALIGRSILVRYLEDRGVLTRAYFEGVAQGATAWKHNLDVEGDTPVLGPPGKQRFYDRVLRNADFTAALFERLAEDFNGDLFALGEARGKRFSQPALHLLRAFLLGEVESDQRPLFFWAYDFEVVPLALISSIYEQFYHDALGGESEGNRSKSGRSAKKSEVAPDRQSLLDRQTDKKRAEDRDELRQEAGTHYTPANLVHDALRRTLTPARLTLEPKILDPACGSGVFLVEAFRRVVRFEAQRLRRKLSPAELRAILQRRVFGIEINAEAARVAAFSLYLALLDQQEPPDIASGGSLPYLLHSGVRDERRFGIIIVSDAFALTDEEQRLLSDRVDAKGSYEGRVDDLKLLAAAGSLDLTLGDFDVVVGNPPWHEAPDLKSVPRLWASAFRLPAGEGSFSQLFIHRAMTMLREGGALGLLVGMKVFWNDRDTSRAFRKHLLTHAAIDQVVNMAHVRRVFFAKAVAPFAFVLAEKRRPNPAERAVLWNARRVGSVERLRTMSAVPLDRRVVAQADLVEADHLWKVFWWGGHHDAALVSRLRMERTLGEAVRDFDPPTRYGWQRGNSEPTGLLAILPELSNRNVQPFGPLQDDWFLPPPGGVKRDPDQRIYDGRRLVITHGVREPLGPVARLEDRPFSFRHSFYCIPLRHVTDAQAKTALGVLWSSLGRYLLFMTAGSWGGWHDKVTARDLLGVPIRFAPSWGMPQTEHEDATARVVRAVELLRASAPAVPQSSFFIDRHGELTSRENDFAIRLLDAAIFDLFELSLSERDLVEDFWAEEHDLFWKGAGSSATTRLPISGAIAGSRTGSQNTSLPRGLSRYLCAFLDSWEEHLPEGIDLSWRVIPSPAGDALAVTFDFVDASASNGIVAIKDWASVVACCAAALSRPVSPAFHVRRLVRAVTNDGFVVLKENARRLWTASTAREDAEALFVQLASRRSA